MDRQQKIEILKQVSFLEPLSDTDLNRFLDECYTVSSQHEEVLFEEGSCMETMYIVLSGEVEIYKENKKIASRKQGDFFGEMALLESKPRSASVRSCTGSLLLEINKKQFESFLASDPKIILALLKSLSSRSREELEVINWSFMELRKNEHRYRGIIETISDIIIQIDPGGKIVFVNSAVSRLGYDPIKMIDQPFKSFIGVENMNFPLSSVLTKRSGKRSTLNQEITLKLRGDSKTPTSKKITLLLNSFGLWDIPDKNLKKKESQKEFLGTVIIGRDITERKKSEESLKKAHDELESRVKERTSELTELNKALQEEVATHKATSKKLQKTKVEAEKANQAKSEFLSRMSHELRTPLNAILGFSQLLEMNAQSKLSDIEMKNLGIISSAGKHLLELINEVLDLSKVESGNIELSIEATDIVPIVDNVISISQSLADEKGISFEYQKIPEDSCLVDVDPLRFKQVVLNLVSNAIKYNKPDGSVLVSYEKQENGMMRLGIRDTGYGIPDDKRDNLFKPFERFDADAEYIEGTGIGLTITKKLIELMNGTIDVESKDGEGSFFYIDVRASVKAPLSI
jgi:signal transduction histidine kinase